MPIEPQPGSAMRVWKVTISDQNQSVLYKDVGSTFAGQFNVYWIWDASDRLWLYNSDDGMVYFWELQNGAWSKNRWERASSEIKPPLDVYPDYAKRMVQSTNVAQ
jgi:hypothetical protein